MKRATTAALALIAWLLLPETGNCFYSPSTGRWLSRDTMQEEGGENLYCFINGDPVSFTDAMGESIFGKRPKPETQVVLGSLWSFNVAKAEPPANPGPWGGNTFWKEFPDPGLTLKGCECGGSGRSCSCGGAHLVSAAATTQVSYWVTKRKYEKEELSNVSIIRAGWHELGGALNALSACVSRACAECWLELGNMYWQVENTDVHVRLLQADLARGIDRSRQLNEKQHELDELVQQGRTIKARCDVICAQD